MGLFDGLVTNATYANPAGTAREEVTCPYCDATCYVDLELAYSNPLMGAAKCWNCKQKFNLE